MKLDIPTVQVERSADFEEEFFGVADMAMILSILRKYMYSEPISTIIQEVSSNARDANREVEKRDTPIKITLPNVINNFTLKIEDDGPGVTPQRMTGVFLKYGASTKREDNKQTGGFGFGAKTPFAYGDSFTIITITLEHHFEDANGERHEECFVRREYIAYIDETRKGKMARVKSEVTDEAQGTTILIPIKENDVRRVRDAVIDRLQYWKARPTILGESGFEWPKIEKKIVGEKSRWFILGVSGPSFAIIDEIPYPIHEFNSNLRALLEPEQRSILQHCVCLEFDTGDVPLIANRMEIDYSKDETKQLIADRLKAVYVELQEICSQRMSQAKNLWQANLAFFETGTYLRVTSAEWNGIKVSGSAIGFKSYGATQRLYCRGKDGRITSQDIDTVVPNSNVLFVQDDDPDGTMRASRLRIATIFEQHPNIEYAFVVRLPDFNTILRVISDPDQKALATIKADEKIRDLEIIGHFNKYAPTLISTFAKAETPKREKSGISQVTRAYVFNTVYKNWIPVSAKDIDPNGSYVLVERRQPIIFGAVVSSPAQFVYMVEQSGISLPYGKTNVYGIPKRFQHLVDGEMEFLEEVLKQKRDEINKELQDTHIPPTAFKEYKVYQALPQPVLELVEKQSIASADSVFSQFVAASRVFVAQERAARIICDKAEKFGIRAKPELNDTVALHLKAMHDECRQRYPMLFYLDNYLNTSYLRRRGSDFVTDVTNYLQMCDEFHAQKHQKGA